MNKKQITTYIAILIAGILLGWLAFGGSNSDQAAKDADHEQEAGTTWTCSMHPSVEQDEPGQCPICGMDLIPKKEAGSSGDGADEAVNLQMTHAAEKLAQVQTTEVKQEVPTKKLRLNGKVKADETRVVHQTSHFPGRIDRLYVDYTGQFVQKGERLGALFSPELITAQRELFEAMKSRETNPSLFRAAKNKLRLWKLSEAQIQSIIDQGEVQTQFDFRADVNGYVIEKNVNYGDHVKSGAVMYKVADLSEVWVEFDAYEQDIQWLQEGDNIEFEVGAYPGRKFKGRISFIDPVIDPKTRIATVRTEVANPNKQLKPEMFANGVIKAQLGSQEEQLVVPKSAVMWTGPRSVVFVKQPHTETPQFRYKEVELGPDLGDKYVIKEGLKPNDQVVTNGTFMIDAAAQLQSKASMMNQDKAQKAQQAAQPEQQAMTQNFRSATPVRFQQQLGAFIQVYLQIKDSLVNDKPVQASVKNALDQLEAVDMKLLKDKPHMAWMNKQKVIKKALENMNNTRKLDEQRSHFIQLSKNTIQTAKSFGIQGVDALYVQHCPMANNNEGADWLSSLEQIRNPYFGKEMLNCGSVTDSIIND